MMKRLLFASLLFLAPSFAVAGSFDAESGVYTSNLGYTIVPPKGWFRVDNATVQGIKSSLPGNIAARSLDRFDVIFFQNYDASNPLNSLEDDARIEKNKETLKEDPKTPAEELAKPIMKIDAEPPAYVSSISVIIQRAEPPRAPEAPKAYEKRLTRLIAETMNVSDVKVLNSTFDNAHPAGDAYLFTAEFRTPTRVIQIDQTLLFHGNRTAIITCSSDQNEYAEDKNWCTNAARSFKFKD